MNSTSAVAGPHASAAGYLPFLERLAGYLQARRTEDEPRGLLVVHLRNLNRLNAAAGYRAAHELRRALACSVTDILRGEDWMMPLTEDRFAVILDRVRNAGHLVLAASRIARLAAELPRPEASVPVLDVRTGAALFPEHGRSAEKLLQNCELAVELAALRKLPHAVFEHGRSQVMTGHWGLEMEIGPAIENGEFRMFYQPKVDAATLRPSGAEALMRWNSPRLGRVTPSEFIPVAETSERIDALTEFALHSAARDAAAWPCPERALTVAVNLSPAILERGDPAESFERVAAIWGIPPQRMTAEVTENGIVSTSGRALRVLRDLRSAGVRVSIDDFGTGNSSLAYFKDIPADELKIDRSFVLAMDETPANRRLVKTIIDLAHGFDLSVVAEGVETAEAADRLRELGCDALQGFWFAKPLAQEDLLRYLERAL